MLKGKKVNLRLMRRRDLETFVELSSDMEARGPFYPLKLNSEVTIQQRFDKDGYWSDEVGMMLVVDQEDDRILGMVVHFKPCHYYQAVEIGYIVFNPADRGKGIMEEALTLFVKYLFELKPIHRIQLQIQPGNLASKRVAEKCGFKYEGTARHAFLSGGKPVDIDVLSIVRSEVP